MTEALLIIGIIVLVGWVVTAIVVWIERPDLFSNYGNPFERRDKDDDDEDPS